MQKQLEQYFGCKIKIAEYKNKLQWGCDRERGSAGLVLFQWS